MKIYVAGHRGLVGSATVREIEKDSKHVFIGQTRAELDLLDRDAVFAYLAKEKPDGTPRKLLDVSRLTGLGWKAKISLEDGIRSTYEWYKANNKG